MKAKRSPHQEWLNNYSKASKWAAQYSILKDLKRGGGLAFYPNFFPEVVAHGIMQDLLATDSSAWLPTEADQDYTQNNISHSFMSTKKAKGLEAVSRVLSLLLPKSLHVFSAAKYTKSDHIERHDDRAYTDVLMDDGNIICCSRDIAVIVYFTPNWTREQGGILLDLEAPPGRPTEYVPQFNSAVVFRIPRWHAVTPVSSQQPRLTVFGWFLVPGKKYPLLTQPELPQQPQPSENAQHKRGKHKAGKHAVGQTVNGSSEDQQQQPPDKAQQQIGKHKSGTHAVGRTVNGSSEDQQQQPPDKAQQKRRKHKSGTHAVGRTVNGSSEDHSCPSSSEVGVQQPQQESSPQQPILGEGGECAQGKASSKRVRAGKEGGGGDKGKAMNKKQRGSDEEEPAWRPGDGSILRLVPKG